MSIMIQSQENYPKIDQIEPNVSKNCENTIDVNVAKLTNIEQNDSKLCKIVQVEQNSYNPVNQIGGKFV